MSKAFLKGSDKPLCQAYSLALLDLDGVVYRGADPVEHAAEGIDRAVGHGMAMAYTTNNPSRYPSVVADQLRGFGLELEDRQVITSGIVGARMLRQHLPAGSKVLVIGSDHLRDEVKANGLQVVESNRDEPQAVIQSWYPDLKLEDLNQATYAIERGAHYYVTNRDLTIPREDGIAPGNGALQLPVIAASGHEPEDSAGKPESAIYDEARRLFSDGDRPVPKPASLPVGDRLDTDIEAAVRGGYDSLIVLTGVATPQAIITAAPNQRPSFIAGDLRGLLEAHPQPVKEQDGSWSCRGSQARIVDGAVTVTARDTSGHELDPTGQLDALRAVTCAVWEVMDAGLDPSGLTLPTFHIHD
ncbi:HAD-IIA family hydrolase [Bifidobacterium xylocopae]|uniref:HAD family hydrolase n=1 Tax=Bifidobacterium xylocopae TaxID=2493119 RepID=A0A366KFK1_9BIFI|nr:HAD-IIA family hydrolase [Bifidobacterium xylocopae]RBP99978.1 HAD family hydrolase [Bifidobacterium xylocopae]